jgi:hypothetical protein
MILKKMSDTRLDYSKFRLLLFPLNFLTTTNKTCFMMKKVLFSVFGGMMALGTMAQVCTPDPNFTPTSATGAGISDLPCAVVNQVYNESATIVVPTTYNYNGINVNICKVRVDSVTNFPQTQGAPNYTIYYNSTSYGPGQWITLSTAAANDRACVRVNNTFTAVYQDSLRAWASVQLYLPATNCGGSPLASIPVSALNNGQGIGIGVSVRNTQAECDGNSSISESLSNNSFDVAQNFPNPFTGESQIAYNLPQAGKVNFRVTNLVGKVVTENTLSGNAGVNYMNVNASDYAAGVYMYSLTFGGKTITKRMIVK